jgi:flagellar basal-body rod protein FlgB
MSVIPEDPSLKWASTALDWCVRRHRLISSNIVNRDTPGYRAQDLDFEKIMDQIGTASEEVLRTTDPGHLPGFSRGASNALMVKESAEGLDGNSVKLSEEMAHLVENNYTYQALLKHVNRKFQAIKLAVQGG